MKQINDNLSNRIDKIDKNKISKEDFQDIFISCYESILKTRTKEKRQLITNLLLNTISFNNISFDDCEYILRILDGLTILQIICFVELSKKEIPDNCEGVAEKFLLDICKKYNLEANEVIDNIQDLEYLNLVQGFISQYSARDGRGGIIRVGISTYITEKGLKVYNNIILKN